MIIELYPDFCLSHCYAILYSYRYMATIDSDRSEESATLTTSTQLHRGNRTTQTPEACWQGQWLMLSRPHLACLPLQEAE